MQAVPAKLRLDPARLHARRAEARKATACIRKGAAREVIVALAMYSGEGGGTITFEVVATQVPSNQGCW